MKRLLALTILAAPVAQAHTLDPAGGLFTAAWHQLLGLHHLPLTLLVIAIGVAWFKSRKKRA
ncbi:MAG: hypothetical protein QNI96_06515 [Woeseiaceae bacterium]|nr:hypothetical protein [Woeseiaceae bacterium]